VEGIAETQRPRVLWGRLPIGIPSGGQG